MQPTETADKLAIAEQLANYARAMDRIDHDLGYAVWHPEGTARYGTMFEGTGRDFIDWVCATHAQMIAHMHRVTRRDCILHGGVQSQGPRWPAHLCDMAL